MAVQHTFQVPDGVTIHACDNFPPRWEIALYRSDDGTPVVDVMTAYDPVDHDVDETPHARLYLNEAVVHEHMSAAARAARDKRAATWAVFLRHRSQQAALRGQYARPATAAQQDRPDVAAPPGT